MENDLGNEWGLSITYTRKYVIYYFGGGTFLGGDTFHGEDTFSGGETFHGRDIFSGETHFLGEKLFSRETLFSGETLFSELMTHLFKIQFATKKFIATFFIEIHKLRLIDQKLNSNGIEETLFSGQKNLSKEKLISGQTIFRVLPEETLFSGYQFHRGVVTNFSKITFAIKSS